MAKRTVKDLDVAGKRVIVRCDFNVKMENGVITNRFAQLVQPNNPISFDITDLTGITNDMLEGQPSIRDALAAFLSFIGDTPLIGHNIQQFDLPILNRCC